MDDVHWVNYRLDAIRGVVLEGPDGLAMGSVQYGPLQTLVNIQMYTRVLLSTLGKGIVNHSLFQLET